MAKTYVVRKGDSPWKIANDNNISLDEFYKLNPTTKNNHIGIGQSVRLSPDTIYRDINIREEHQREDQFNLSNISAIQGYRHTGNYVIVDKKNRTLTIFDKNNNPIYQTSDFATGASGNDYNTITYSNDDGTIRDKQGNNSTPAGISTISNTTSYHGFPAFIRQRTNANGVMDNIASSLHLGPIGSERKASNGCIRVGGRTLQEMQPYLSSGTKVYTLPEQPGSRFTLRGGKLNFTADNPYGISLATNTGTIKARKEWYQKKYGDAWEDEFIKRFGVNYNEAYNRALPNEQRDKAAYQKKYGKDWEAKYNDDYHKRYWDDYNIDIDKSFSPLILKWVNTGNELYDRNRKEYAQSIVNSKQQLQSLFGLTSDEYNRIAELALGIAEQETKFGTANRYITKQVAGETLTTAVKGIEDARKNGNLYDKYRVYSQLAASLFNPGAAIGLLARGYYDAKDKALSRGFTQIKNKGDNPELTAIYNQLGIDDNTIKTAKGSAIATIARLAYMYSREVKGRTFTGASGDTIDPYHALLYKWMGYNNELTNHTATPSQNKYIRNVNQYARNFDMYDHRAYQVYKYGGRISLEDI